jgi:nitrite reductase/ring-hydroxylating ferredoxin subunit
MEVAEKALHRILPVDEIPERGGVLAQVGDEEIGIFKSDGVLYAYENRCVHQGGPVCTGEILGRTVLVLNDRGEAEREIEDTSEMRLVCPWHGWEYVLATGEVAHNRRSRLRRFEVLVDDGIVYVRA